MKRLTEIGIKTGTDKATQHGFTEVYDPIFSQYVNPRIFEIGVFDRSSIDMYVEYFDNPYVLAMDNEDKSYLINDSWKFVHGDQASLEDLRRCLQGEDLFDIILDDGGHTMKQQQISFGFLVDYVKPGGYYILEDLHTSMRDFYIDEDCEFTSFDMITRIVQKENYFSNYICKECQKRIIKRIESAQLWIKNKNDLHNSITCIIKMK